MLLRTFKYSFSLVFLFVSFHPGAAQDTIRTRGVSFGVDLSRAVYKIMEPERLEIDFLADVEIMEDIFLMTGFGYAQMNLDREEYTYSSEGYFLRIGADYNILNNEKAWYSEMIHLGVRIGYSRLEHEVPGAVIHDSFWGNRSFSLPRETQQALWIGFAGGIRAELFPNFMIGWSIRGRVMLSKLTEETLTPVLVPGYGKGIKTSTFGVTYSVHYRIPF